MANTRQITNYSYIIDDEIKNQPPLKYGVRVPKFNSKTNQVEFITETIGYKHIIDKMYVTKFGITTSPNCIIYPFLLKTTRTVGDYEPFFVAKNGCYEFQQEELLDRDEDETQTTNVVLTDVWSPYCRYTGEGTYNILPITFCCDFVSEDY